MFMRAVSTRYFHVLFSYEKQVVWIMVRKNLDKGDLIQRAGSVVEKWCSPVKIWFFYLFNEMIIGQ